jgi:hypothetical protein
MAAEMSHEHLDALDQRMHEVLRVASADLPTGPMDVGDVAHVLAKGLAFTIVGLIGPAGADEALEVFINGVRHEAAEYKRSLFGV